MEKSRQVHRAEFQYPRSLRNGEMADKIDNGGPAFARAAAETSICGNYDQEGMSLRDYFAAQALSGQLAGEPGSHLAPLKLAPSCYEYADAMIAARKAGA